MQTSDTASNKGSHEAESPDVTDCLQIAQRFLVGVIDNPDRHHARLAYESIEAGLQSKSERIRELAIKNARHLLREAPEPANPLDRQDVREARQVLVAAMEVADDQA